jgi:hypothetical protein
LNIILIIMSDKSHFGLDKKYFMKVSQFKLAITRVKKSSVGLRYYY